MKYWFIFLAVFAIFLVGCTTTFTGPKFLPDKCVGPTQLPCIGRASFSEDMMIWTVQNKLGYTVTLNTLIEQTNSDCDMKKHMWSVEGRSFSSDPITLENGEIAIISVECQDLEAGTKNTDFTINYLNTATGEIGSGNFDIIVKKR